MGVVLAALARASNWCWLLPCMHRMLCVCLLLPCMLRVLCVCWLLLCVVCIQKVLAHQKRRCAQSPACHTALVCAWCLLTSVVLPWESFRLCNVDPMARCVCVGTTGGR